jgi:hypothetical protein
MPQRSGHAMLGDQHDRPPIPFRSGRSGVAVLRAGATPRLLNRSPTVCKLLALPFGSRASRCWRFLVRQHIDKEVWILQECSCGPDDLYAVVLDVKASHLIRRQIAIKHSVRWRAAAVL